MKHLLKILLCVLTFGAFIETALAATPVTEPDVKKFVEAIPDVETFADRMKAEGKEEELQKAAAAEPDDKSFTPYAKGVQYLKASFPEDYKVLGDIVTKHGFESQESWAEISDRVMHAYMAIKIQSQNPDAFKQIQEMDPKVKAKMPPEMQAQMERMANTMKVVSASPPESRAAVKTHLGEIDAWMERSKAKEAPPPVQPPVAKEAPSNPPKSTP